MKKGRKRHSPGSKRNTFYRISSKTIKEFTPEQFEEFVEAAEYNKKEGHRVQIIEEALPDEQLPSEKRNTLTKNSLFILPRHKADSYSYSKEAYVETEKHDSLLDEYRKFKLENTVVSINAGEKPRKRYHEEKGEVISPTLLDGKGIPRPKTLTSGMPTSIQFGIFNFIFSLIAASPLAILAFVKAAGGTPDELASKSFYESKSADILFTAAGYATASLVTNVVANMEFAFPALKDLYIYLKTFKEDPSKLKWIDHGGLGLAILAVLALGTLTVDSYTAFPWYVSAVLSAITITYSSFPQRFQGAKGILRRLADPEYKATRKLHTLIKRIRESKDPNFDDIKGLIHELSITEDGINLEKEMYEFCTEILEKMREQGLKMPSIGLKEAVREATYIFLALSCVTLVTSMWSEKAMQGLDMFLKKLFDTQVSSKILEIPISYLFGIANIMFYVLSNFDVGRTSKLFAEFIKIKVVELWEQVKSLYSNPTFRGAGEAASMFGKIILRLGVVTSAVFSGTGMQSTIDGMIEEKNPF